MRWSVARLVLWRRGSSRLMKPSLRGQVVVVRFWTVSASGEQPGHNPAPNRLVTPKLVEALRLGMARKGQRATPRGVLRREGVAKVLEKDLGTRTAQVNETLTTTTAERALAPKEGREQLIVKTASGEGWPTCVPSSLLEAWMLLLLSTSQPILLYLEPGLHAQRKVQISTVFSLRIYRGRCSSPTLISGRLLLADLGSLKLRGRNEVV